MVSQSYVYVLIFSYLYVRVYVRICNSSEVVIFLQKFAIFFLINSDVWFQHVATKFPKLFKMLLTFFSSLLQLFIPPLSGRYSPPLLTLFLATIFNNFILIPSCFPLGFGKSISPALSSLYHSISISSTVPSISYDVMVCAMLLFFFYFIYLIKKWF